MTNTPIEITLSKLVVSAQNVRKNLDAGQEDSGLENLAENIAMYGMRQAIEVRPLQDENYEIIAGQRRFLACERNGLKSIACVVLEGIDDDKAMMMSLSENLQRADMHPLDKANALKQLYKQHGTIAAVAKAACLSPSTVSKYLNINKLSENLQEKVGIGDGSNGIAYLSKLATTFEGKEAGIVFDKLSGFNGNIKLAILKRSAGDLDQLDDLIEDAQEGAFDIKRCDQQYGCQVIRSIITGEISNTEFEEMVETAATRQAAVLPSTNGHNPVHEFWKTLANPKIE